MATFDTSIVDAYEVGRLGEGGLDILGCKGSNAG
jgi:hypothetical protein